jgi:hypothetical protein
MKNCSLVKRAKKKFQLRGEKSASNNESLFGIKLGAVLFLLTGQREREILMISCSRGSWKLKKIKKSREEDATRKRLCRKTTRQRRVTPPRQKSCAREESTKDCAI